MHATNGEKYYISFLDAYSKFTWLYLLHSKSQALVAFKTFKLLAENQTGLTIKTIQTDNAKEFHCFKSFINESGIQHRFTCPHTHEQNGAIERKHHHIVDMGLSMLYATSLPMNFWDEAFLTTSQIINVLPSSVIKGKTPHELLFHKKPDYTIFKSFGCACYPLLRSYNLNKLNFRSTCCLFLGYSQCNKGYICRSPDGRIYISRNVVFNEDIFPYSIPKYGFLPNTDVALVSQITPHVLIVISSSPSSIPIYDSITLPTSPLHNHTSSLAVTTTDCLVPLFNQNVHPMTTRVFWYFQAQIIYCISCLCAF